MRLEFPEGNRHWAGRWAPGVLALAFAIGVMGGMQIAREVAVDRGERTEGRAASPPAQIEVTGSLPAFAQSVKAPTREHLLGAGGGSPGLYRPLSADPSISWLPPFARLAGASVIQQNSAVAVRGSGSGRDIDVFPSQVRISPLVSDSQFVWGPSQASFDISDYLQSRDSDLAPFANEIELWARYSSVSPRVLLAVLEMRYGLVSGSLDDTPQDEITSGIEGTAMDLSLAFYEHLYTFGSRRPPDQALPASAPALSLESGEVAQIPLESSSGSYAIAAVLASGADGVAWAAQMSPESSTGFPGVFADMFPDANPLATTYAINPPSPPPDDLLQFPFPLGATWYISGAHSWNGGDFPPPYSSLDMFLPGGTCEDPPKSFSVAAADGIGYHPYDYQCWYEIDHGDGWTTSYYHLSGVIDGGDVNRNQSVGRIDCRTCAGGFATGPHVHFSLKYNGAYLDLEGVKLSGWTVHVGDEPYDSGYLERDGNIRQPYSTVQNDYHLYYPHPEYSLLFRGNGSGDIDRVKISLDHPFRPVDAGAEDFTLEWWMMASREENPAGECSIEVDDWREGNILFDRDVFGPGDYGEYGVSLAGGRIAFGVRVDTEGALLCGVTDVADGYWHHIAVSRQVLDGRMDIFVDGILDAQAYGPAGDISYRNRRATEYPNDPFLVIGAEKHDLGIEFPSYSGWIDEIRLSNVLRYSASFSAPDASFITDPATLALYSFDEGAGDFVNDTSGNPGGPSNGVRMYGGTPTPGPEWSTITPFGPSFTDVPPEHWAFDSIEAIFSAGLTKGCENYPPVYCPERSVTRAEMAVFLERVLHGSDYEPPEAGGGVFADVPAAHWAGGWIEQLYADGVTSGCATDPLRYCPDQAISRAEMAVFLERVKNYPDLDPPPAGGGTTFEDVSADHWAVDWIEQLYVDGITGGCSRDPLLYCPESPVTRAEMAVFLGRLLNLP
jgi:hypothetical protein